MKDWTVVITYKIGTRRIESVHRITGSSESFACEQAERELNHSGIAGTFFYKVYGGQPTLATDKGVF